MHKICRISGTYCSSTCCKKSDDSMPVSLIIVRLRNPRICTKVYKCFFIIESYNAIFILKLYIIRLYWVRKRIRILWCSDHCYTHRTNEVSVYEQEVPWKTDFIIWQYSGSQLWKMIFCFLERISDKWHWINSYCSSLIFCRFFSQFRVSAYLTRRDLKSLENPFKIYPSHWKTQNHLSVLASK